MGRWFLIHLAAAVGLTLVFLAAIHLSFFFLLAALLGGYWLFWLWRVISDWRGRCGCCGSGLTYQKWLKTGHPDDDRWVYIGVYRLCWRCGACELVKLLYRKFLPDSPRKPLPMPSDLPQWPKVKTE
ncbi:MAG: hypothetical protein U1C49_00165 [Candidatus Andersenbacteria bacterium]|nr:hypothetical protein [bacterium]MDZ4225239.1 hypothetical protein [Candidatus Andersenbacteria bacterium]